jgi:hypothetical protein
MIDLFGENVCFIFSQTQQHTCSNMPAIEGDDTVCIGHLCDTPLIEDAILGDIKLSTFNGLSRVVEVEVE